MYKITLYDFCCSPICDGVASFYTDSLEDFESKWLPKMKDSEPETVERYFRSKGGEIVTDYYSDYPDINIVQEDSSAEVLEEQSFEEKELDITLYNIYGCSRVYHINSLKYVLRKLRFQGKELIVAKYSIKGICNDGLFGELARAIVWGNPVCEAQYSSPVQKGPEIQHFPQEAFADDRIECFVWLPQSVEDIHRLNEEELDLMLHDLPGEAG